jgi:hypothetical protein
MQTEVLLLMRVSGDKKPLKWVREDVAFVCIGQRRSIDRLYQTLNVSTLNFCRYRRGVMASGHLPPAPLSGSVASSSIGQIQAMSDAMHSAGAYYNTHRRPALQRLRDTTLSPSHPR